jgi:hypothetical protein
VRKNQSKEPSPEKNSKRSKPSQRKAKAFTCGPLGALELAKREQRKVYDTLKEQGFILNVNSFLPEEHITWMHGHFPNPHPDELLYAVRADYPHGRMFQVKSGSANRCLEPAPHRGVIVMLYNVY